MPVHNAHNIRQLAAAILLMILYGLLSCSFGFFQEAVTKGLNCSRASFNLCYTVISIMNIFTVPVIGRLLQRYPTRRVLSAGGILGALGFLVFSLSTKIWMLYFGAVLIGLIQHGCTSVAAILIVNHAFAFHNGTPTGIAMAGTGLGSMAAGLLLVPVIEASGWQNAYRLLAIFWLAVLLSAGFLSDDLSVQTEPAAGNGHKPQALSGASYKQAIHSPYLYTFMAAFVLLALNTIFYQHLPAFFTEIGYTAIQAGRIMSLYSFALIFCKISLGWMFDKLGAARTVTVVFSGYAASLWMFLSGSRLLLLAGIILIAFGMAAASVLMPLLAEEIFGRRAFSSIWSILTDAMLLGNAFGAPLWGMIYDRMGTCRPAVSVSPFFILADAVLILYLLKKSAHAPWRLPNVRESSG